MSLALVNNAASLTAQHNLSRTSDQLSTTLQRLSTGLKINKGADGPAALVMGEQQRAQLSGLQATIDQSSRAVAMVQTADGGLNQINSLLSRARSLAVDSAGAGDGDPTASNARQAEMKNVLDAIDSAASSASFNGKKIFDGSFVLNGPGAELAMAKVSTSVLGIGTGQTQSAALNSIDVSSAGAAGTAVKVIDQAIKDVSDIRGKLGAFQSNVLASTSNTLTNTLGATAITESRIRDTDFAQETAAFTRSQVLVQAGTTVLSNANQTSQLVLSLLR